MNEFINLGIEPMSIEDMIIVQAPAMKQLRRQMELQQAERIRHGEELKAFAAKIETRPAEYFTIGGYAHLRGIKVDINEAYLLEDKATKLSNECGYQMGEIYDPNIGQANSYHLEVLASIFDNEG